MKLSRLFVYELVLVGLAVGLSLLRGRLNATSVGLILATLGMVALGAGIVLFFFNLDAIFYDTRCAAGYNRRRLMFWALLQREATTSGIIVNETTPSRSISLVTAAFVLGTVSILMGFLLASY